MRGWSSLALKIFALLAAKNHFVFYFFVSLKKRKWFLLGSVFIEILVCKIPAFAKPFPVKCNIFSELTPKTSLLFFRLKILKFVAEKSCVTIETRTELCVEIRCVKICCAWQTKFTWYLKPENQTLSINVAFSFFKFRKYNTAFNSGLKIWLVSGIFWNGAVV